MYFPHNRTCDSTLSSTGNPFRFSCVTKTIYKKLTEFEIKVRDNRVITNLIISLFKLGNLFAKIHSSFIGELPNLLFHCTRSLLLRVSKETMERERVRKRNNNQVFIVLGIEQKPRPPQCWKTITPNRTMNSSMQVHSRPDISATNASNDPYETKAE